MLLPQIRCDSGRGYIGYCMSCRIWVIEYISEFPFKKASFLSRRAYMSHMFAVKSVKICKDHFWFFLFQGSRTRSNWRGWHQTPSLPPEHWSTRTAHPSHLRHWLMAGESQPCATAHLASSCLTHPISSQFAFIPKHLLEWLTPNKLEME